MVKYACVGTFSVGVRHKIGNAADMVDDVGAIIVGILVCSLSTVVTVDSDKVLIYA